MKEEGELKQEIFQRDIMEIIFYNWFTNMFSSEIKSNPHYINNGKVKAEKS